MRKISSLFFIFLMGLLSVHPFFAQTLVFLHSNDTHGIYKPYLVESKEGERWIGGMAAAFHYIQTIRAREDHVFFIDTGDVMTGTLAAEWEYNGVTGGVMVEFLNRLKCDVWCLGNHEFDLGYENALRLARLADFPTVLANVVYKKGKKALPVEPYHLSRREGLRVGFVGIMEEKFLVEVQREKVQDLDVIQAAPTLRKYVEKLDEVTDLIVVLYHGSFKEGVQLAEEVEGADVILVASDDGQFKVVNGTLVQSTWGHQKTLGYLKVRVDEDQVVGHEAKQIWLWADGDFKPSGSVLSLIKEVDRAIQPQYKKVIGRSLHHHFRHENSVERALGDWITDAMRWKTGAQIGFQNTGGIRNDIKKGPITVENVYHVSPFHNTLVVFQLTGRQIKDVLEHDIQRGWDRLQVSGLKYKYYAKSAKPSGKRVSCVIVNGLTLVKDGKVLYPDKVFTAVSNSYLVGQAKDKYFGFSIRDSKDTDWLVSRVLSDWLNTHKILDYQVKGRIIKIIQ